MMRCFAKLNKKMCLEERQTEPNTSQASQKREAKLNSNSAWEMRQTKLDIVVQARIIAKLNNAATRQNYRMHCSPQTELNKKREQMVSRLTQCRNCGNQKHPLQRG